LETKLQKFHRETGISQKFIADKAMLTPGAYSLIVRGAIPRLPSAIRIVQALNEAVPHMPKETVESLWGYLVE
jgi:transcriptional regulator with XRE-family HTH domain